MTNTLLPRGDERFVEGEVDRVTFENASTGFRVVKLAVDGAKDRLTVVGVLPVVHVGARLRVRGRMVTDERHGEQLRVEGVTLLAPNTKKGIERYLASGVVPGVGEKLAARIVLTLGDDTLRVLDEEPDRLRDVPGLGKKRALELATMWRAKKAERDVLVFLQAHGATASLAAKIVRKYGGKAVEVVQRNPYQLALDVIGIGFRTADQIAGELGVSKDAPERMQAGVLQGLLDATDAGHVYAPMDVVRDRATALLIGRDAATPPSMAEVLETATSTLAAQGHVIVEGQGDGARVYLPRYYAAERRLAARVAALSSGSVRPLPDADAAIRAFEASSHVTLAPEQRAAVLEAAKVPFLVITGGPGVGKTTVQKAILAVFERAGLRVSLAAPTGRAAKRMSVAAGSPATTLHRLLEFDPKRGAWKRDARMPLDADAVVVDEASMIDLLLADALFDALGRGARLVLVGDKDQLPSIGPGAVLRDVIASGLVPCVRLERIFRQAHESLIVVNAHRIHDGEAPVSARADEPNADFFIVVRKDPDRATATILELVTESIPRRFGMDPVRDVQVLTPMHRGPAGSVAINAKLQEALNPRGAELTRGQRTFRVGDKVMQLKNDYERSIWNGDIGVVRSVDPTAASLTVSFEDDSASAASYRDVRFEAGALDHLTLAYACSVHKAQGSEFPAVVIPLLTSHFVMLSQNLLYTAVTRGKRLVVLVADPRAIQLALAESRRDERFTRLADRIMRAAAVTPH